MTLKDLDVARLPHWWTPWEGLRYPTTVNIYIMNKEVKYPVNNYNEHHELIKTLVVSKKR